MITDLFSKRNRAVKVEPLVRDYLPNAFRAQVVHIFKRALGERDLDNGPNSIGASDDGPFNHWKWMHDCIAEEHGCVHFLGTPGKDSCRTALLNYFLSNTDVERSLDVIELCVRVKERLTTERGPNYNYIMYGMTQDAVSAVADLNTRFDEHNLGYQYEDGRILRRDSQYLHAEVAEPVLKLLNAPGFQGPEEEFRSAHIHLRHGRMKEATVDALKAFESTMKAICSARSWTYDPDTATAKTLVAVVLKEGLLPSYLEGELGGLRSLLESCVPTVRNRNAGHGQGPEPKPVPAHLAAFALHSAAANIVLLMQAHLAVR